MMKNQSPFLFLITILMSMGCIKLFAHDIAVANADGKTIYYKYINKSTELAVTYNGTYYSNYPEEYYEYGYIDIPETVTYNGKIYTVTSIEERAFKGCRALNSITIPNSVTSIGSSAFSGCSGLTSITIPNSVTSIGNEAFYRCSGLKSITIPNSVTSIGNQTFSYCSSLTSIIVENGNANYDSRDNCNAIIRKSDNSLIVGCKNTIIPNSVTSIGSSAFSGCSGLTSISIPNSVTSVGNQAFSGCSSLTTAMIGNSVTSIGNEAFFGCRGLTSITIPSSVTSINRSAFLDCYFSIDNFINNSNLSSSDNWGATIVDQETPDGMMIKDNTVLYCRNWATSVTIPNNVTSIGNYAFYWCSSLSSIKIPNSVTSIGEIAFYGCYFSIDNFINNSNISSSDNWGATIVDQETPDGVMIKDNTVLYCRDWATSVTIPNNVTSIGYRAFYDCSDLTSIKIPNSVTNIGNEAFSGCSGLTSITIPNSVTSISDGAFAYCSGLTFITIPNSVTSIGSSAFRGCSSLTSITIPNNVTSVKNYAFASCTGLTSITIGISVTSIGRSAFYNCIALNSITIPNSVTSIGGAVFLGCSSLTTAMIGNSVTNIGNEAFFGCSSLNSITIPNSVMSIEENAFNGCSGLTSVTIPYSVTSIGGNAFSGCDNITTVNSEITEPFNCGNSSVFSTNTYRKGTLYIPAGTKDLYTRFDGWREFLKIEEVGDNAEKYVRLSIRDGQGTTTLRVKQGTEQELTITPEEGWKLLTVTMDGQDVTAQVKNGGTLTTPAIMQDATITVVYEQDNPSEVSAARQSQATIKVVDDGVIISDAEPNTRCAIYQTDGKQMVSTVINDASRKITLTKGQAYILTLGTRTLKFSL